ncbi:hypothetical protein ACFL7E_03545 [Thermodesulfobacteriota bacterium]
MTTPKTSGWDDKFFYVEHKFVSTKDLYALILVKARVIGSGRIKVSPSDVLRYVYSEEIEDIKMNESIATWAGSSQIHWNESNLQH